MKFNQLKESNSTLRKEEMKNVRGGGSCGFKSSSGTINCNVTKTEALFMVQGGGHWCCESCASTTYCGD